MTFGPAMESEQSCEAQVRSVNHYLLMILLHRSEWHMTLARLHALLLFHRSTDRERRLLRYI
jgi:hypothetical protein